MKLLTKLALAVSISLNLCLAGILLSGFSTPTRQQQVEAIRHANVETPQAKPPQAAAQPAAFQWSQLESEDFTTFVKNLRGIGCPETTIRDIVRAELDEIYEQKERMAASMLPANQTGQLKRQMAAERDQVLNRLLAFSSSEPKAMAPMQAVDMKASAVSPKPAHVVARIPAAFAIGHSDEPVALTHQGEGLALRMDSVPAGMAAGEALVLAALKSDFAHAMGSTDTPSSDSPEYLQRWNEAQSESDERFRLFFGGEAFVQAQIKAVQAQTASQTSATQQ